MRRAVSVIISITRKRNPVKYPYTLRMLELSFLRTFAPGNESSIGWNFRSRERKFHGIFVPWNFRSLELSLPGTKVTWNFRSLELSLPGTFVPFHEGTNYRSRNYFLIGLTIVNINVRCRSQVL